MLHPEIVRLLTWLKSHNVVFENVYVPMDNAPVPVADTFVVPTGALIDALECRPDPPASTLRTVTVAGALNLRDAPSVKANVVAKVPNGAKLLIESETGQGDWVIARLWVHKDYLK